jgi:hypothetical protein
MVEFNISGRRMNTADIHLPTNSFTERTRDKFREKLRCFT